ncbi:tRNA pseudouridine(55) synthase TruB [Thermodesulfobacteriota bacterium]
MQQSLDGVIIVDKPSNISSAKVVMIVKKLLGAQKTGHTGTLDPFATGVLVCCINRATKLARFFLGGPKKYEGLLHLGIETDTQDLTGNILSVNEVANISEETIRAVFEKFEGTHAQTPPIFSALKHKGTPLYKLARMGRPVQKPPRPVTIYRLDILHIALPFIRFEVSCSAGTYIRTLCADLGKRLGCGGHLKELRRLEINKFTVGAAATLPELETLAESGKLPARVIPMAAALHGMPELVADEDLAERVRHGKPIREKEVRHVRAAQAGMLESFLKVVSPEGELLAVIRRPEETVLYEYCCVFN